MTNNTINETKKINYLLTYAFCLLISSLFFLLFSYNSPVYNFNNDVDYHWYMTLGNGLIRGKLPYRDIFDHKGPIVYFISAFCCLFPKPGIAMLIFEIIVTSFFFFITFIMCKKILNTFYSLAAIPLLGFSIFTSWTRFGHGAIVEEYCLPLLAFFLLIWLEFIFEKKDWNWQNSLIIGVCIGICFWIKLTILIFFVVPIFIWIIINLQKKKYQILIKSLILFLGGFLIITIPILLFYGLNNALDDLWFAYFIFNTTAYPDISFSSFFSTLKGSIGIGPAVVFFILYGTIKFSIRNWRNNTGKLLLISFLTNLTVTALTCKGNLYYFNILMPYAILGIIESFNFINKNLKLPLKNNLIYIIYFSTFCLAISILLSFLPYDAKYSKDDYAPIVIADVIKQYKDNNHPNTTLLCYLIGDQGIHNLTGILPNNYFFAKNYINQEQFPQIYKCFETYIKEQTSDFVITDVTTWIFEYNFLSQYYMPYTGDIETSTYDYTFGFGGHNLILLFKKN